MPQKAPVAEKTKRRIFLVDDHPLVREWLTSLINHEDDLMVCGEASSAPEALLAIDLAEPDAAVVDITLENGSGLDLIKDMRACHPGIATVVLSMHDESLYGERALRAGARGYVTKRETTKKVISALRQVLDGKLFISDEFAAALVDEIRLPRTPSQNNELSERETQVFQLLGQGFETRRIAESLNISMKTVQTYCARIKEKLNVTSVNELMREAVRWAESGQRGS